MYTPVKPHGLAERHGLRDAHGMGVMGGTRLVTRSFVVSLVKTSAVVVVVGVAGGVVVVVVKTAGPL